VCLLVRARGVSSTDRRQASALRHLPPAVVLGLSGELRLWGKGVSVVSVGDTGAGSEVLEVDLLVALVAPVGADAVVSVFPADDFVAPVSNLVAEGLHGENGEGLFHLRGEFLNTEQKEGDHGGGGDHANMVPGGIKRLVEGKGHEKQPEGKKSSRVAVVNKGDRGSEETFARSEVVLKDGESLVHLILSHEVHRKVLNGHA